MPVLFITLCSVVFAVNVGETAQVNLGDSCDVSTGITCDSYSAVCDVFLKQCRIKHFMNCSGNLDKCVTGAQCLSDMCQCIDTAYDVSSIGDTCEPKPGMVNGNCIGNTCKDVNAQCSNNKCICKSTHSVRYSDATCDYGKRCELRVQNSVSPGRAGNSLTGSGILIFAILCLPLLILRRC